MPTCIRSRNAQLQRAPQPKQIAAVAAVAESRKVRYAQWSNAEVSLLQAHLRNEPPGRAWGVVMKLSQQMNRSQAAVWRKAVAMGLTQ